MGAGSFNAGLGPAGHDPLPALGDTSSALAAGSPMFDPLTKSYPLTADGSTVEEVDPVWQEVAHRLGIPLGALSFAPEIGFDVEAVRKSPPAQAQRTVEDTVNRALAPMIARGDVEVVRVDLAKPWSGKWDAFVKNLRDPANATDPTRQNTRSFGNS